MKGREKGRMLRQKYGLTGCVDVQDLADRLDLRVAEWPLPADEVHEITRGRRIAVSHELNDQERRWAIAHGIGHRVMHPGNHSWLRAHTWLAIGYEREAEQFAYGLLVDEAEAEAEQFSNLGEAAEHFGVPMHTLWENAPDTWGQTKLL